MLATFSRFCSYGMADLRDQLQASLGGPYRIEQELEGGGMSRVFVAEELALGRRVVVKVLPEQLAGSVSIDRFRREISVAARLQHPHIVPLLSAGETEGLPYYTMPYIEGQSLRARLARGELPIAEAISLLRDIARGLEYAHAKGIAHRDIKPDNVLIAGTSAMITDFGVAKAISEATEHTGLTSSGIAVGTPAYMAPEQAAADPATDYRADIYAFGTMAYEMLAGHAPFAGRSTQAMLAAHMTQTPPEITTLRPATPPALAELVTHCLEKRPADRPQSAGEIVRALDQISTSGTQWTSRQPSRTTRPRWIVPAIAAAGLAAVAIVIALAMRRPPAETSQSDAIRSIAVLPFENASRDTALDYLEDGISDHVRDALNAVPGLTVKARGSSRQLVGRDPREIGTKLGVGAILQGTVSGSKSRLHVTAELVRTSNENALWSSTFDGPLAEVAGVQDTLTRAVAAILHLGPSVNPSAGGKRGGRGTSDVEAYNLFLQGRHAADRLEFARSVELLRAAVARDPAFARAHAYLAMNYANLPATGVSSVDSLSRLAQASIDRALALDSNVAEAYVAESFVQLNEGRFADGAKTIEKAVKLDPNNADIRAPFAVNLAQIGRVREGLEQARQAAVEDPLSSSALGILEYLLYLSGDYPAALRQGKAAIEVEPSNPLNHKGQGFLYAFNSMPDSAVAELETAFKLDSMSWGARSNLVFGYAAAGRWQDAARQRDIAAHEAGGNSPHWSQLMSTLSFGDYRAAMTALERGVANKEPLFGIISIPCDPLFNPLKSDPRFLSLMRRLEARACPPSVKWPIGPRPKPAG